MSQQVSEKPKSRAPAVKKAIQILKHLGRTEKRLGVNEIARETGLVPSSCLHILRELLAENLVSYDEETKKYGLGAALLSLARQYSAKNPFAQAIRPAIDRMAKAYGLMAVATVHSSDLISTVVAVGGELNPFTVRVEIGSRFHSFAGAAGRCVAAYSGMARKLLEKEFNRVPWANKPKFPDWLNEVQLAKERGWAIDEGNYINGVTIFAVPIFGKANTVTEAISTIDFTGHSSETQNRNLLKEMLSCAADFAHR